TCRNVLHQLGSGDLGACAIEIGVDAEANVHVAVTVEYVVGATTFQRVVACAAQEDVAVAPDELAGFDQAITGRCVGEDRVCGRVQVRDQRIETGDPVETRLVE